jgi:hypothetical protein
VKTRSFDLCLLSMSSLSSSVGCVTCILFSPLSSHLPQALDFLEGSLKTALYYCAGVRCTILRASLT